VYKRGYGKVNKDRIPLTDNAIVEQVGLVSLCLSPSPEPTVAHSLHCLQFVPVIVVIQPSPLSSRHVLFYRLYLECVLSSWVFRFSSIQRLHLTAPHGNHEGVSVLPVMWTARVLLAPPWLDSHVISPSGRCDEGSNSKKRFKTRSFSSVMVSPRFCLPAFLSPGGSAPGWSLRLSKNIY
jgi:hypothetical protein